MMTRIRILVFAAAFSLCVPGFVLPVSAQIPAPFRPISMEGVNQFSLPSAASRGAGGLSVGFPADPSLMFVNPASLQGIEGIHVSVSGINRLQSRDQSQQWFPMRSFPTFSLLMEGLLDEINDPDLSDPPPEGLGPEDSIPRAFDNIKPNWSQKDPSDLSIQGFVAVPVEILGFKVVGGAGIVEYANLNYYYQNNNELDPQVGAQRPVGVPLPAIGQEVKALWWQHWQQRRGSIYGYGGAVSVGVTEELSVGFSGLWLDGQSDDAEFFNTRARIRFGNNSGVYYHRLDSVYQRVTGTGTSEYYGAEYSISSVYRKDAFSFGLMVKPPSKVSRRFDTVYEIDTTGTPVSKKFHGREKILLPWRAAIGAAFQVRDDLMLGIQYEINPFASAEFISASGESSKPWLSSSSFRVGAEFLPAGWMALRVGFRDQAEIFEAEGNALSGEAVRFSVYSFGLGFSFAGAQLNLAYEYSHMKYQDMWQTNVNLNSRKSQSIVADISYVIQ